MWKKYLEEDGYVLFVLSEKGYLGARAKSERALLALVQVQRGRQRDLSRILLLADLKIEMYSAYSFFNDKDNVYDLDTDKLDLIKLKTKKNILHQFSSKCFG